MQATASLGYPSIGQKRELKRAVEAFLQGTATQEQLEAVGAGIRKENWSIQKTAGISIIPSNDFSFVDAVYDLACDVGVVANPSLHDAYEMDRSFYFGTHFQHTRPKIHPAQVFFLRGNKAKREFLEARSQGIVTRPVLLGPLTFLHLCDSGAHPNVLLPRFLGIYCSLLKELRDVGVEWVQIEEPILCAWPSKALSEAAMYAYNVIAQSVPLLKCQLTLSYGHCENKDLIFSLPVAGLHINTLAIAHEVPQKYVLSLGLVDGTNVWQTNYGNVLSMLAKCRDRTLIVAPTCSLRHVPYTVAVETALPEALREQLSFAEQKLHELVVLAAALGNERRSVEQELLRNEELQFKKLMQRSQRSFDIKTSKNQRRGALKERRSLQQASLQLPVLPIGLLGALAPSQELRDAKRSLRKGEQTELALFSHIDGQVAANVAFQEENGCDVVCTGEPERSDSIDFFFDGLDGVAQTEHAWVQVYGHHLAKPPIVYGDISRPKALTVATAKCALKTAKKPVKATVTGPWTLARHAFLRDDQTTQKTMYQLALAIRNEMSDLEHAGVKIIQLDEPFLQEGHLHDPHMRQASIKAAVELVSYCTAGLRPTTQLHLYLGETVLPDFMPHLASFGADVLLFLPTNHSWVGDIAVSAEHLATALEHFGIERIWLTPQKSLRGVKRERALEALLELSVAQAERAARR